MVRARGEERGNGSTVKSAAGYENDRVEERRGRPKKRWFDTFDSDEMGAGVARGMRRIERRGEV